MKKITNKKKKIYLVRAACTFVKSLTRRQYNRVGMQVSPELCFIKIKFTKSQYTIMNFKVGLPDEALYLDMTLLNQN